MSATNAVCLPSTNNFISSATTLSEPVKPLDSIKPSEPTTPVHKPERVQVVFPHGLLPKSRVSVKSAVLIKYVFHNPKVRKIAMLNQFKLLPVFRLSAKITDLPEMQHNVRWLWHKQCGLPSRLKNVATPPIFKRLRSTLAYSETNGPWPKTRQQT